MSAALGGHAVVCRFTAYLGDKQHGFQVHIHDPTYQESERMSRYKPHCNDSGHSLPSNSIYTECTVKYMYMYSSVPSKHPWELGSHRPILAYTEKPSEHTIECYQTIGWGRAEMGGYLRQYGTTRLSGIPCIVHRLYMKPPPPGVSLGTRPLVKGKKLPSL